MTLELTRKCTAHIDLLLSQLVETIRFAWAQRGTQHKKDLGMQFGSVVNAAIKNVDAKELDKTSELCQSIHRRAVTKIGRRQCNQVD
jgi:hypothetical protein